MTQDYSFKYPAHPCRRRAVAGAHAAPAGDDLDKLLPRKAEQQAAVTQNIDKNELQPGDLVFFNTMRRAFSHVGIYVGNGKFIHSPKPGAQVRVESLSTSYWDRRFDGARRVTTKSDEDIAAAPPLQPAATRQ